MAHLEKKIVSYTGGIESRVEGIGIFFLIIGLIAFSLSVYFGISSEKYEIIIIGATRFILGLILWIIFTGIADLIRHIKKSKGLPFGGKIILPEPVVISVCSECGSS